MEGKGYNQPTPQPSTRVEVVESTVPHPPLDQKKSRGCVFWGCIGCGGFALLLGLILLIGVRILRHKAEDIALEWTTDQPLEMREIALSGDVGDLAERWVAIEDMIEYGGTGVYIIDQQMIDMRLTEQEQRVVDVILGSGEVSVSLSFPLRDLEVDALGNRYFNVQALGTFSYDAGKTDAYILDIAVPGKQLPQELLDELMHENIGPHLYREEEAVKFIQQFKSIQIEDGQIVLEMRE